MQAIGYTEQKETPMTIHTRTEECEFGDVATMADLSAAAGSARSAMMRKAEHEGFLHMVDSTFKIVVTTRFVTTNERYTYTAAASATFAKIVSAETAWSPDEPIDEMSEVN